MDLTNTQDFEMGLREKHRILLTESHSSDNNVKKTKKSADFKKTKSVEKRNIYHLLRDLGNFYDYEVTTLDKLILYTLESRGDEKRPSHEELAFNCRTSITSVQRSLKSMKKAGLITWDQVPDSPNLYFLNNDWILEQVLVTREERKALKISENRNRLNHKPIWNMTTSNGETFISLMTDKEIKEEIN